MDSLDKETLKLIADQVLRISQDIQSLKIDIKDIKIALGIHEKYIRELRSVNGISEV